MAEGKRVEYCEIPSDFVSRMNVRLGEVEWAQLQLALESEPGIAIQCNPLKPVNRFVGAAPVPWFANGLLLATRPSYTLDPLYHAGAYYSQESSSMFLAHALTKLELEDHANLRALDLCAAPGGKSLLLAHFLEKRGVLISNEINKQRNAILVENLTKSGCANYVVANASSEAWGQMDQYFDIIAVDAPCSGEGMFRKDMQARKEWSLTNVERCAQRQKGILQDVLPALRPGGYLIYSTCTFAAEENENVLAYLRDEWNLETVDLSPAPDWQIETVDADGMLGYRFWPHRVPGEGLFMAVLRAPNNASMRHRGKPKSYFHLADKKQLPIIQSIVDVPSALMDGRGVAYHCPLPLDEMNQWAHHVYFTSPGRALGEIKHQDFIPDAALALSVGCKVQGDRIEVNEAEALRYLRGDGLELPAGQGLALITFEQHTLGWVKRMGARNNNYYPKEWRIRMR